MEDLLQPVVHRDGGRGSRTVPGYGDSSQLRVRFHGKETVPSKALVIQGIAGPVTGELAERPGRSEHTHSTQVVSPSRRL